MGRVDIRAILADPGKRRRLLVGAILALQHREGIPTTVAQATNAYDRMRRRFMGKHETGVERENRCWRGAADRSGSPRTYEVDRGTGAGRYVPARPCPFRTTSSSSMRMG